LNDLFLFHLVNTPNYGKKKLGKPFLKFTLSAGKEEILRKPEGLGLAVFFLKYNFVRKMKKYYLCLHIIKTSDFRIERILLLTLATKTSNSRAISYSDIQTVPFSAVMFTPLSLIVISPRFIRIDY
jgi:hypothetical protein